ncbi:hypothetical protein RNJ44_03003 [Nakaseomyces bracarensis]|uniref:Uncharacterized protein n=1 Tax=Nakaseomyces bracarensis TaxID=273131 RepID=A0ABR4NYW7_9SACH
MAFNNERFTPEFTLGKRSQSVVRFLDQESDDDVEDYHYSVGLLKKRKSVSTPRSVEVFNYNTNTNISITPCPTPDPYKKRLDNDGTSIQDLPQSPASIAPSVASDLPRSDFIARERCFDYIVQSIDEVWARYVDSSSNAETMTYYYQGKKNNTGLDCRDTSFETTSDESSCSEDEGEEVDDEGYNSEVTTCTDDVNIKNLQSLKYRLTNAKNDLELNYDSPDMYDSIEFWRRWDMIKYSAVELMEDDDDDELIESVIEELEAGRNFIE